jgi:hypothetical protein
MGKKKVNMEIKKEVAVKQYREVDEKKLFHKFFLKIKDKLKLKDSMEIILWKHLVSIKHTSPDKYKDGIKHFGYKIEE